MTDVGMQLTFETRNSVVCLCLADWIAAQWYRPEPQINLSGRMCGNSLSGTLLSNAQFRKTTCCCEFVGPIDAKLASDASDYCQYCRLFLIPLLAAHEALRRDHLVQPCAAGCQLTLPQITYVL